MTENQIKTESALVKKVGDIANVMAAAGVGFTDYIIQLTYILFLKMDEEKEEMGLESTIPDGYKWKDLVNLNGTDLIEKDEELCLTIEFFNLKQDKVNFVIDILIRFAATASLRRGCAPLRKTHTSRTAGAARARSARTRLRPCRRRLTSSSAFLTASRRGRSTATCTSWARSIS